MSLAMRHDDLTILQLPPGYDVDEQLDQWQAEWDGPNPYMYYEDSTSGDSDSETSSFEEDA